MPSTMENLATLNSFLRTILTTVVLGVITVAGWFGYTTYNAKEIEARRQSKELAEAQEKLDQASRELSAAQSQLAETTEQLNVANQQIDQLNKDIENLNARLTLLKVDHRLARLTVVDQGTDEKGEPYTVVKFVELNDEGQPIGKERQYRIRGDVVYIDNWIVKFDDKYVEQADIDRSTSLVLFRRIFGEMQQPIDGFPLDEAGQRPQAYARGGKETDLEKKIWGDFWNIANDEAKAKELGIRAAHGQAVSMKLQKDKAYRVQLRASDGLSIVPEDSSTSPPPSGEKPRPPEA
jgi:outer membrane murein-binding lipoprotein Lpp